MGGLFPRREVLDGEAHEMAFVLAPRTSARRLRIKRHISGRLPHDRLSPRGMHVFSDEGLIGRQAVGCAPEDLANPRIVAFKNRNQLVAHSIAEVLE